MKQKITQVSAQRPTLRRFRRVWSAMRTISLLRALEYERLEQINLRGRVLDFGGGSKINYSGKLKLWTKPGEQILYESANIDPKTEPTYLIEENGSIPAKSDLYDAVIALNTFEHVYDPRPSFKEIYRVLKVNGSFSIIVPFIFRVHGHPDDYFRGTPSFWSRFFGEHGFGDLQIEALTWGPFSTAFWISGQVGPLKRLRMAAAMLLDVAYFAARHPGKGNVVTKQDAPIHNIAMGYFISAKKTSRHS
jgi:SAM-dependent methyltransferase